MKKHSQVFFEFQVFFCFFFLKHVSFVHVCHCFKNSQDAFAKSYRSKYSFNMENIIAKPMLLTYM